MAKKEITKKDNDVKAPETEKAKEMPFGKINYILVGVGIVFLALGFILMTGGGSDDPDVFNEEMFNFRRITLAPILCLIGFVVEIVAIMKRPKKKIENNNTSEQ